MTETETTRQESTTRADSAADLYERLRDSAPKEARVEWRDGDRWASSLREKFQELAADEDLSEQGKCERAQRNRETATPKIERG